MDLQTPLNIAAAVATVGGFGYGIWQQRRAHSAEVQRTIAERDRAAAMAERLVSARAAVVWAADVADLVVQRSKEPEASMEELANVARTLRGNLQALAGQLRALIPSDRLSDTEDFDIDSSRKFRRPEFL